MTEFNVVDAALEGFRLTRERPSTVLAWGALLAAVQLLTAMLLAATGLGDAVAAFNREAANLSGDAATRAALMSAAAPGLLISGGSGLLVNTVVYTALLRTLLRPAETRFAALRLGLDELRQLGVGLALGAAAVALMLAGVTALALPVLLASTATGAGPAAGVPFVLALAVAAVSYPVVRLSLAPALSFAERRFGLVRAWPLSKGLFWPLLGAYLLAALLSGVVAVLSQLLMTAVWALGSGVNLQEAAVALQPDVRGLARIATPGSIAAILFAGVSSAFVLTIAAAPGPAAFRQLSGRAPGRDVRA